MLGNFLFEHINALFTLAAADDLAIAFGG